MNMQDWFSAAQKGKFAALKRTPSGADIAPIINGRAVIHNRDNTWGGSKAFILLDDGTLFSVNPERCDLIPPPELELERHYRLRDDLNGDVWENEIFETHMEAFDAANEKNKRALKRHDEDGSVGGSCSLLGSFRPDS